MPEKCPSCGWVIEGDPDLCPECGANLKALALADRLRVAESALEGWQKSNADLRAECIETRQERDDAKAVGVVRISALIRERDEALRVNAEQGERLRTTLRNIADALPVPARLGDAPKQAAEAACEGDADVPTMR